MTKCMFRCIRFLWDIRMLDSTGLALLPQLDPLYNSLPDIALRHNWLEDLDQPDNLKQNIENYLLIE